MEVPDDTDQARLNLCDRDTWRAGRDDIVGEIHLFLEMNLSDVYIPMLSPQLDELQYLDVANRWLGIVDDQRDTPCFWWGFLCLEACHYRQAEEFHERARRIARISIINAVRIICLGPWIPPHIEVGQEQRDPLENLCEH